MKPVRVYPELNRRGFAFLVLINFLIYILFLFIIQFLIGLFWNKLFSLGNYLTDFFGFSLLFVPALIASQILAFLTFHHGNIRKLILILGPIILLIVFTLIYLINKQPCEGVGCIVEAYALAFGIIVWLAIAPVISVGFVFRRLTGNMKNNLKILIGPCIASLIIFVILLAYATSPSIALGLKEMKSKKIKTQTAKSKFTFMEPTYLPKEIGKKYKEYPTGDIDITTEYMCGESEPEGLFINQIALNNLVYPSLEGKAERINKNTKKSQEEPWGSDLDEIASEVYVNGKLGVYSESVYSDNKLERKLVFNTDNSQITLDIFWDCEVKNAKEEIIKIAESMKPARAPSN